MRVSKWGNGLAVRLPVAVIEALGLEEGSEINVVIADKRTFAVSLDKSRQKAIERLRKLRRPLPSGFTFDREAEHDR
jgi:antitoxin MazE